MEDALAIATRVKDEVVDLLGDDVVAVWHYGSAVFGHPFIDVDMHTLLRRKPDKAEQDELNAIHDRSGADIDGWFILLDDARGTKDPFHLAPRREPISDEHWALHRAHWLAGRCVVLHGLSPSEVVVAPKWEELEATLHHELDHERTPGAYGVLQLCRVWASIETKDVVRSKLDSAAWALERLNPEHHGIVEAAGRFYRQEPLAEDEALLSERFAAFRSHVRDHLME